MSQGGWLDELDDEYRRGGQRRRRGTSKNIQSSINDIFRRNYDVFGPAGKQRFDPRSRYEEGGWLDQYQEAGQLRAASTPAASAVSTLAPKVKTNPTGWEFVKEAWANRDQGPSDWNMMMMDKTGSYTDSGVDPFTLMLAAPQQVIKTATSAAKNLGNVVKESPIVKNKATEFIKETVKHAKKAHKWSKENIQDIKDLPGQYKTAIENLTSKEGLKRLKDMGVEDTDDFIKFLNNVKLNATMERSHFFPVGPGAVSINPAQIKKLKETMVPLGSQKSAIDHELGHAIQYYLENKGKTFNRLTDLDIEAAESLAPHMTEGVSDFFKNTRGMDYESAKDIAKNLGESSGNYLFRNKREPVAHLRETKRAMVDNGVISNIHETVTPEHIQEFILRGGDKDRILSFLQQTPEARQTLSGLLNKTPALIPIGLGVGAAANQKKMGGWLDKAQLGKIITRPLTLLTKTEMLSKKGKNMGYRKIGNIAGLQDLIRKKGAQAPAPMKMRSGLYADTPFFGMGKKPNENYRGIYAVEVDPHNPKYNWTSRVAGTDNLGVAPIDSKTGELIKNIPLEDLNVYRKKWFSDNYKRLDPENLEEGLKNAKLQSGLENAWKWGVRGTAAVAAHDYISKDSDDWAPQIQNYLNIKQKGGNNISESTFVRKPIVSIKQPNKQPTADDLAWYSMIAAQERQPDVLQQKQAQGKGSKAWDIMMNPFTAAGHMYQHGSIPDNFTQGPTSALDIAPSFVNPLFAAEMVYNTGKAAVNPQTYKDIAKTAQGLGMKAMGKEGPEGWQEAGLNTLGIGIDAAFALPGVRMAKGLKKNIGKSINKSINKTAKGIKKGVSENMRNYPRPAITPTNFKTGGWLDKYNNF
jgi:prefoldin subunit 5